MSYFLFLNEYFCFQIIIEMLSQFVFPFLLEGEALEFVCSWWFSEFSHWSLVCSLCQKPRLTAGYFVPDSDVSFLTCTGHHWFVKISS